jgi:hypothetical protein
LRFLVSFLIKLTKLFRILNLLVTIDLISKILKLDASERITITDILEHPWFQDDDDPNTKPPSAVKNSPLGSTPEEATIVAHLEALGMDVNAILSSVHSNACDQASALWYLLLAKHRPKGTNSTTNSTDSIYRREDQENRNPGPQKSKFSTIGVLPGSVISHPVLSSSSISVQVPSPAGPSDLGKNVNMEQYLANARRRKSMPLDMGSSVVSGGSQGMPMMPSNSSVLGISSAAGGRRGMMLEAMRSSSVSKRVGARFGRRAMEAPPLPGIGSQLSSDGSGDGEVSNSNEALRRGQLENRLSKNDPVLRSSGSMATKSSSHQILEESEGEEPAYDASRNRNSFGSRTGGGGGSVTSSSSLQAPSSAGRNRGSGMGSNMGSTSNSTGTGGKLSDITGPTNNLATPPNPPSFLIDDVDSNIMSRILPSSSGSVKKNGRSVSSLNSSLVEEDEP